MFSLLNCFPLMTIAQDVILLKSVQKLNVKVLKEDPESVRFILSDDSTKTEKELSMKYVEFIEPKQQFKGTYEGVVTVDMNITQNELYIRAKEWVALRVRSAKDAIQMNDKNSTIQ